MEIIVKIKYILHIKIFFFFLIPFPLTKVMDNNIVRPLGCVERYFIIVHEIDYYYNVGLTIRYKIPINLSLPSTDSLSIPNETKNIILSSHLSCTED